MTITHQRSGQIGAVALVILTIAALLLGAGRAAAAPPYLTQATLTDLAFASDTVQSGSAAELTAKWSLPDAPATPAGFTIDLPPDLEGRGDTFLITAKDDPSVTIATCVATATQLQCDFDAAYLAGHPRDLKGDVSFWVAVNYSVETEQEHTFTVGGVELPVTVTPGPGHCTDDCSLVWNYHKDGRYNYANDTIVWWAHVAAPTGGMAGGQRVTVKDTLTEGAQTLLVDEYHPALRRTNTTDTNANGYEVLSNWEYVPRSDYQLDPDGTVTFTTDAGYYYEVEFASKVTDQGASVTYSNSVEYLVEGVKDGTAQVSVRYAGGGGTGVGTDVGVFTIAKKVEGAAVPADLVYSGSYTVTSPAGTTESGTFAVKAGETWRSAEFAKGGVVHLAEVLPTGPAGVSWSTPEFSSNDFELVGGAVTAVTLTNRATAPTPTPTPTPTPPVTVPPTTQPPVVLPQTGTSEFAGPALGIAAVAVLAGGVFLMAARRRDA